MILKRAEVIEKLKAGARMHYKIGYGRREPDWVYIQAENETFTVRMATYDWLLEQGLVESVESPPRRTWRWKVQP